MLCVVTDDQFDARRRLGISESDPDVARVVRGAGSITVVGLAGAHAVDVLYRSGPGRFGRFDATIVDTSPVKKGGCLPGVLLIAPTDGDNKQRVVLLNPLGGWDYRLVAVATSVTADNEGCGTNSMRVFWAKMYEDSDREWAENLDWVRPEDL